MTVARRVTASPVFPLADCHFRSRSGSAVGIGPGDLIAFEERAGEIVLRPVRAPRVEDPFATFTEWSSEADEEAYAGL